MEMVAVVVARTPPAVSARLSDPRPAGIPGNPRVPQPGFRYRSIASIFSVWGYDVRVERTVREFLDLSDVRANGLVVQGSGTATVRTAPLYQPRHAYAVSGTGDADQRVVADAAGAITFRVDLGASHTDEQYSPQATALEAAGSYWTTREIGIHER